LEWPYFKAESSRGPFATWISWHNMDKLR